MRMITLRGRQDLVSVNLMCRTSRTLHGCLRRQTQRQETFFFGGAGESGSSVESSTVTGDSTATSAQQPAAVQSNLSDKRSAWGNYQAAYIYAGKLVSEGKGATQAAKLAADLAAKEHSRAQYYHQAEVVEAAANPFVGSDEFEEDEADAASAPPARA